MSAESEEAVALVREELVQHMLSGGRGVEIMRATIRLVCEKYPDEPISRFRELYNEELDAALRSDVSDLTGLTNR